MSTSGYSKLIYGIKVVFRHELLPMSRDRFDPKTGAKKTVEDMDYRIWASHNGTEIQLPDPEDLTCELRQPSYTSLDGQRRSNADKRIYNWIGQFIDEDVDWDDESGEPTDEVTSVSDRSQNRRWVIIGRVVAESGSERREPTKVPENCRPSLDELKKRISPVFRSISPELYLQTELC